MRHLFLGAGLGFQFVEIWHGLGMEYRSVFGLLFILRIATDTPDIRSGQIEFFEYHLTLIMIMVMFHLKEFVIWHSTSFKNWNCRRVL